MNFIKGKGKYFRVWKQMLKNARKDIQHSEVMEEVTLLTQLKEKARTIEQENITLADENDELRQFSTDGFKIAQNITLLSAEREQLTSDLADYGSEIKSLLEKKQRLEQMLAQVLRN